MRIGLVAPPWIPVPPPHYGGTEAVLDGLARGLAERGHEVRLFTVGESTCPVRREHFFDVGVPDIGSVVPEAVHVLAAYEALVDVDVIHDHTTLGALLAGQSPGPRPPVVVTHHSAFTDATRRIFSAIARTATVVATSRAQADGGGQVPIRAVIPYGVDLDLLRPGPGDGGYVLFVGRMTDDKGVDAAVRIARQARMPLRILSTIRNGAERAYYEGVVRPLLAEHEKPLDDLDTEARVELFRHATALLNPIRWEEPFGLVMAEALACGTPVVAFPHGAAPEIVTPGVTGFLPGDEESAVRALREVPVLDRAVCRSAAEERFSLQRMALDHERLYQVLRWRGDRAREEADEEQSAGSGVPAQRTPGEVRTDAPGPQVFRDPR